MEEIYDHIKIHYSEETNCVSFTSNANVALTYNYNNRFAMLKIPKRDMGEKVVNAGQYMLEEITKRVNSAIEKLDRNDEKYKDLFESLEQIEKATSNDELKEIIKRRFIFENGMDTSKIGMRRDVYYKSPTSRISKYSALNEEQLLEKNKIISRLTVLERTGIMKQVVKHKSNTSVISTIGGAFSSSEQIYYGDIEGENFTEISKEFINIIALLQQSKEKNPKQSETISKIENEIVTMSFNGYKITERDGKIFATNGENEISLGDSSFPEFMAEENKPLSIKDAYEITGGRLEYSFAQDTVKKIFYLSKGTITARKFAEILDKLTGNNPEYKDVIESIKRNGIDIENEIINRRSKSKYKISEAVGIEIAKHEEGLIETIQNYSEEELQEIIESRSINGTKERLIENSLSKVQENPKISENEYYARAIFSMYKWEESGIRFTESQKETFIKKLQEKDIASIYEKIKNAGIDNEIVQRVLLNLIVSDKENVKEILDKIEKEDIRKEEIWQILEENSSLNELVSASQIEDYLEFYKVEGTDIKLKDYQKIAIDRSNEIYKTKKFASVILPTGTGKTFVAIAELMYMQKQIEKEIEEKVKKIKEQGILDRKTDEEIRKEVEKETNKKMLYLAPSNEILEQVKKYAEKYIHGSELGKSKDDILKEIFPNLELATYQSLLQKSNEELKSQKYRFIVLDELHRTGAEKWGEKLNTLLEAQSEDVKVMGITATPERDVDGKNMADEIALKLGYTEDEIENKSHVAMKMDLIDAIRLGIIVNPRVVECEYNLKYDNQRWEQLKAKIDQMEEGYEREEALKKYEALRKRVEHAKGIPELMKDSITKKDGRYILFISPNSKDGAIEDEEGNVKSKNGKDKIADAEKQIKEWLKLVDTEPEIYSMLGEYGDKKNSKQLESFEKSDSDHIKIMIVINKLNEGVHVIGVDGIIWQRALDEDSKILLLQQLGRCLYAIDEEGNIDENRPLVIDLPNNLTRVDLEKIINTYTETDDIELLNNVLYWMEEHGNILPDINSSSKEEARMAITLKRIQAKYLQYINDEGAINKLEDKKRQKIESILDLGSEIDLWDLKLKDKIKTKNGTNVNENGLDDIDFSIEGLVKDLTELENFVNEKEVSYLESKVNQLEKWCVEHFGTEEEPKVPRYEWRTPKGTRKENMTKEEEEEYKLSKAIERVKQTNASYIAYKREPESVLEPDKSLCKRLDKIEEIYGLSNLEKKVLKLEKWCIKHFGTMEEPKVPRYEWRIPRHLEKKYIKTQEDEEEEMLSWKIRNLKQSNPSYIAYKENPESVPEPDKSLCEKLDKIETIYGLSGLEKQVLKLEEWCIEHFGTIEEPKVPRYEWRMPRNIEKKNIKTQEDEEENKLATAIYGIKGTNALYQAYKENPESVLEPDKILCEKLDKMQDIYGVSDFEKQVLKLEEWCIEHFGTIEEPKVPRYEWRTPKVITKTNRKTEDDEQENKIACALGRLKRTNALYQAYKENPESAPEQDKNIFEKLDLIESVYDVSYLEKQVLKIEKWLKDKFGTEKEPKIPKHEWRMPKRIQKKNIKTKEDKEEYDMAMKIKDIKMKNPIYKSYKENPNAVSEGDRLLCEKLDMLEAIYGKGLSAEDIGKASYTATAKESEEAASLVQGLINELENSIDQPNIGDNN